jgi:triosephosphate isomerase
VWAIGTGEVATPEDAQEVCAAIRHPLAELYSGDLADGVAGLYGGSVKAANVAAIMAQEDVDGALVGGASIDRRGVRRRSCATAPPRRRDVS